MTHFSHLLDLLAYFFLLYVEFLFQNSSCSFIELFIKSDAMEADDRQIDMATLCKLVSASSER